MKKESYIEQLKSPIWQKKRLEIMQRDNFTCQHCGCKNKELHIHHLIYHKGNKPWDYNNDELITLCSKCHEVETEYNNELYDTFVNVRDDFKKHGFSMGLFNSLLENFIYFFENIDYDECDREINFNKHPFVDYFINGIYSTQSYSDAKKALDKGLNTKELIDMFYKDIDK